MGRTGLVLEGGGMRGIYTAGVLDFMLDREIGFDYCIGVSAGVCHGISFVSKQRGRTRHINLDYTSDKRYVSFHNFLRTGSVFGMDFIFDEIPNRLEVFDYKTFCESGTEFVIGVTDVSTGRPVYFNKSVYCEDKNSFDRLNRIARASSAIPVFSPIVECEGGRYLDGGTSDPIPVEKALQDGCDRVVVVLTRHRGFVRQPEKFRRVYQRLFRKYPEMIRCLDQRCTVYNSTLEKLKELEKQGRAFVLAPREPVTIGRFERDRTALEALYQKGYDETSEVYSGLKTFLRAE